jgi:hypothetical protein
MSACLLLAWSVVVVVVEVVVEVVAVDHIIRIAESPNPQIAESLLSSLHSTPRVVCGGGSGGGGGGRSSRAAPSSDPR